MGAVMDAFSRQAAVAARPSTPVNRLRCAADPERRPRPGARGSRQKHPRRPSRGFVVRLGHADRVPPPRPSGRRRSAAVGGDVRATGTAADGSGDLPDRPRVPAGSARRGRASPSCPHRRDEPIARRRPTTPSAPVPPIQAGRPDVGPLSAASAILTPRFARGAAVDRPSATGAPDVAGPTDAGPGHQAGLRIRRGARTVTGDPRIQGSAPGSVRLCPSIMPGGSPNAE